MGDQKKRQVPIFVSVTTYLVMFGGSVLASFFPIGLAGSVEMVPFFALGFKGFCGPYSDSLDLALLIVVNAIFLTFLVCFIRVRLWSTFGALCWGFGIILMLNFFGWNLTFADFPDIASSDER